MERDLEEFIKQNYKRALDYQEIQAYYQPVVRTSSRQLCSFEALARWNDPEIGMIYPDEFVPVLEKEGLINLLDISILRQVCSRIRSSIANGETPVPVSVNLSRLDFTLCDIFDIADGIVSDYQIPHDFIYFEITESIMAEQKDLLMGIVDKFRSAGYQIWMDDFGSAYSSLNVLHEFHFDELKLDMSFMRPFDDRAKRIVTSIVEMAKILEIHTLEEGVETEDQFIYLRDVGCEKVQGYYFGKPLPYEDAMANLREKGVCIEVPQDRHYYDEIGKIDYLSAVPFMKAREYYDIVTARQLNSIPLALAEFTADDFKVLFYNTAFEEMSHSAGMFTRVFMQDMLCKPQPYHMLTRNIINLMDSVKVDGDGRMFFTINEQYYEIKARRMAQTKTKYCALITINNLTKDTQAEKTGHLDNAVRQIYALYDRITLLNYREDSIRPLYTDTREDLLSNRHGIKKLVEEYAERYIFPEDKGQFIEIFDPDSATERLRQSGNISLSAVFRTSVRHGQYEWKEYILLRIDYDNYFLLIRSVRDIAKELISGSSVRFSEGGPYSPEQLWDNLMRCGLFRIFWKDRDRRFLGASKGFLDFYGFKSEDDIIGKNDEEMGWHVHPDLYMNDEYRVIHEGATFHNVPGKCLSHGSNVSILASKTPLYDANGEITGLIGYFIDKDDPENNNEQTRKNARKDLLTGLLNSRGITEEVQNYQDEYYLRGTDFVRVHIGINDFDTINEQYGFDFGDKVLTAFGHALEQGFGLRSAVGRYAGRKFTVLRQVDTRDDAGVLRKMIKSIGASVREIDGKPITLYLSVGYALYSECLDLEEQEKTAEMRLHEDYEHSVRARKRILIADDIESNREILGDLLSDEYDISYASDGVKVMKILKAHKDVIDLLILDLYMPNMTGQEVMAEMQKDDDLKSIPVIVLTVDQKAEVECLKMGAMDFIPKPYPDIEIVKARIAKCLALSEKR